MTAHPALIAHPTEDRWELLLPWEKPPLSMNDRRHWSHKHQWTKALRGTAFYLARSARIPDLGRCSVELVYSPATRRTRDADNIFATLKPLADGLVDAGVVPDDTPDLMSKSVAFGPITKPARLVLVVERRSSS